MIVAAISIEHFLSMHSNHSRPTYALYTDGACSGNPGKGGWAALLESSTGESHMYSGAFLETTNNRMEMTAVIEGVRQTPIGATVVVHSDSEYIVNAVNKGWLMNWQKNGWRTAQKKPVANQDLWQNMMVVLSERSVQFTWVRGHAGHDQNERCDEEAVRQCESGHHAVESGYTKPSGLW